MKNNNSKIRWSDLEESVQFPIMIYKRRMAKWNFKKKKKFTLASEDFETIKVENDIENTAFKYKSFAGPPII